MKAETPPDAEVVAAVLRGQSERFTLLVERYQDALFRHALTLGLDPDAASDMVQDSLVRAWESLAECRDPAHFRIWVGRILRNRCLDHLKRASTRRTTSLHAIAADVQGLEDQRTPNPEGEFNRRAVQAALDQALLELPAEQAEAFLLKHVEGHTYGEMADLTGASISALKMRVHRARDTIRASLDARGIQSM